MGLSIFLLKCRVIRFLSKLCAKLCMDTNESENKKESQIGQVKALENADEDRGFSGEVGRRRGDLRYEMGEGR